MQTSKISIVGQFVLFISTFLLVNLFLPLDLVGLEQLKTFMLLALGVVLGMAFLIQRIKKNYFFVSGNVIWLSMGTVLLSSLLSTVFSSGVGISLFGRQVNLSSFVSIMVLFALSYGVMSLLDDGRQKGRFFLVTYFSAVFAALLHLLNIFLPFFPNMGFFVNNTINTVGKWYELGFLALFAMLASVLVLQFLRHSPLYRIMGWVGLALSAILVILVNSLIIWSVAALFALLYIVLNAIIQHDALVHNRLSYPALGILMLSIVFILVGGKVGVLSSSFFGFQFEEVRPTLPSTIEVIGDTFRTDPIFGVGLNRFEVAWLKDRPAGVNTSNFWDADFRYGFSNLLSIPVTQGIVGTLAWLFFLAVGFYYAFRLLFAPLEQKSDLFIHMYSVLGFVFFTVVMLIYVPSVVLIGLYFIFLGFFLSNLNGAGLIRYREVHIDRNPRVSFAYILALVVLLIAFIYAGFIVVSQYSSRILFERALAEYNRTGDLQVAEFNIQRANFVYSSDVYLRSLTEIGMSRVNAVLNDTPLSQEQAVDRFSSTLQTAVQYAQAAIAYDPQSYVNRFALALIYRDLVPLQVPGAKDEALKVLSDLDMLSPSNPSVHLERARVLSFAKEYDPAVNEIRKAVELKPNYVDAVFLLSQIQVERGQIDEAVASIQAAISVAPNNPNLFFQLGLLKYNQQKYAEAVIAFEAAVTRSPYFGNAKYFLGLSYYQNGRTDYAITQFENLAEMYPGNAEVSLILNNLRAGKAPLDGAQPPINEAPEDRDELPVDEEELDPNAAADETEE